MQWKLNKKIGLKTGIFLDGSKRDNFLASFAHVRLSVCGGGK